MASVGIQFGGNNSAVLDHRRQSSLCVCSPYSNRSVSMIRGSGGKRGNSVVAMARAGLEAVGRERRRGGGNGSEAAAAAYDKLDEWMRGSVVEIVQNLREAPLLVNVYGRSSTDGRPRLETEKRVEEENWDGLRRKWEAGAAPFPDGVIFVEELNDNDNGGGECNGKDDGGDAITKAWGLVVQGKGNESGPACYLLKTSKVNNGSGFGLGMGLGCTHFCLVPVSSFREKAQVDGKYILLYVAEGCDPVNKFYYCDMSALPNGLEGLRGKNDLLPVIKVIDKFDARANDETVFTLLTNKDAPKYKLVRVDLKEPTVWTDVLPESEKDVLESASAVNGTQMIVSYLSDVKYVVQVRDLKSGNLLHQLPIDIGSVNGISARREDSTVFFGFTSFLTPGIIYQCNLDNEIPDLKVFREITVPGFERSEFHVDQVFVPSKDGTKIPTFVVARKNISLDGSHPCLLYGYGGFNISITPSFSVSRIVLTRHLGVVYCIANIRGGGEYGEEWHKAGSLSKKQNCFDDFISAAEYLVSAGYTQPSKLCIEGGSNGGLLVGACINQRPDLFGCALAHVGVMDMLRFHKFTIGHAWTSDYGCSDKEEEFRWLIKYSPIHNVRRPWEQHASQPHQYPSTMLLTADHDDRVVPLHSLKLLATLQYVLITSLENSPQTNPIIGRIECKAGHGAGRPTQKMIDEAADRYSFMAKMLGASWME